MSCASKLLQPNRQEENIRLPNLPTLIGVVPVLRKKRGTHWAFHLSTGRCFFQWAGLSIGRERLPKGYSSSVYLVSHIWPHQHENLLSYDIYETKTALMCHSPSWYCVYGFKNAQYNATIHFLILKLIIQNDKKKTLDHTINIVL